MRPPPPALKLHILTLPRDSGRWNLVSEYLKLRKDVFIDQMNWGLHAHEAAEFEQYDHFGTTYVIAEDARTGDVVGGARLLRTDQTSPSGSGRISYSYMIRDAYLGLLEDLPVDVSGEEPPVESSTWELTRLISRGTAHVAEAILAKVQDFLAGVGAERCLFLGPRAFMRMASRMGFDPIPLGKVVGNGSGRYLAFACDVLRPHHAHDAPTRMPAAARDLNIGLVRQLHIADDETILGTTYEWTQSGKRVTVWHEQGSKRTTRVVDIPRL